MLNAITDDVFNAARRHGKHESPEAYAFDALMAMAQHAAGGDQAVAPANGSTEPAANAGPDGDELAEAGSHTGAGLPPGGGAGVNTPPGRKAAPLAGELADMPDADGARITSGGDRGMFRNTRGRPVCPVPPRRWSNPRYLALLRIDAAALRRGRVEGDELCEITGVGPVPVSVARDLLGEAIVKLVITNGVDVANVTHLGRGPTTAQKIALMWTTPTCTVEGCNRRRIEYDHQKPWSETRHTRLDELDPLCEYHHDLKTRLGWALVPGMGKRTFVPPDDPRYPRNDSMRARPGTPDRGAASATTRSRPATARSRAYRQSPLPTLVPDDP